MTKRDTSDRQDDDQKLPTLDEFNAFGSKLMQSSVALEKRKKQAKKAQKSPDSR